jgi:hypothetical protein
VTGGRRGATVSVLDPATGRYRDGDVFAGTLKAAVPFAVEVDLGRL